MKQIIAVRGLSLARNRQLVLDKASLAVRAGEIVCLVGPSGSGKSSLLRCINRLSEPPEETVFIEDEDVTGLDVLALRRRVGMVFQQVWLLPGTVGDNVRYGAALQKRDLSEAEIGELLTLADLPAALINENSQKLSGGQAQRVAIARVLATQPEVLLLDEPTSALDPTATRHIEETMLKLRQRLGLSILWVTHNPEQAQRLADQVYLLVHGQVVEHGHPDQLFASGSKNLSAVFAAGELE